MGYRSDVTALFYCPEGHMTYTQTTDWLRAKFPAVFEAWPDNHWAPLDAGKDITPLVFKANYVKWCATDFEEVEAFEDMLDWLESRNPTDSDEVCPVEFEFGRIGEETDDMEYRHSSNSQGRMQRVRAWDLS